MIRLGITQRQINAPHFGEVRDALDRRWHQLASSCGLVVIPLPNDPGLALQVAKESDCRGVILSGGDDLTLDGCPLCDRELTEAALFDWATRAKLPILGVCRGMQRLATLAGSTLARLEGHVATRHEVTMSSGRRETNSFHDFSLIDAPVGYEVVAQAGSSIEAMRHKALPVEGIMWHPEREAPFDAADIVLFRRLFNG